MVIVGVRTSSVFFLLCALLPALASAQTAPRISATVQPSQIAADGTVTLTIEATFQGRDRVRVRRPPTGDFRVAGGYSQSFSVNRETRFVQTYRLVPRRTGTLYTPSVELQIGSRTYRTEPVAVEVGAGASLPGARTRVPAPLIPGPPPVPPPVVAQPIPVTPGPPAPPAQRPSGFPARIDPTRPFAVANPSRRQVFVGQPLRIDYEIYEPLLHRWELTGITQPTFERFWFEAVPRDQARYLRRDYDVAGNPFRSSLGMRFVAVPLEVGELTIPPFEAEVSGSFGAAESIVSEPASLEVLPLPQGGPDRFPASNVGDYDFSVEIEPRGTRVGDPIKVTLRVEGTGLVSLVELPAVRVDGAVVQPPVVTREQAVDGETVGGFKRVETVVIPSREGELTIGPFVFHYFDPRVALYRAVEYEATTFTIAGRSPTAGMVLGTPATADEGLLALLPAARTTEGGVSAWSLPAPLVVGLAGLPPLTLLALLLGSRVRRRRSRSLPERRKRSAPGRARRELRAAAGLEASAGYGQIAAALRGYLRERFEIKAGALTSADTARALSRGGVPEPLASDVGELLDACETARFNRAGDANGNLAELAQRAETAVKALEGHVS